MIWSRHPEASVILMSAYAGAADASDLLGAVIEVLEAKKQQALPRLE